jgi:hypothetical protein
MDTETPPTLPNRYQLKLPQYSRFVKHFTCRLYDVQAQRGHRVSSLLLLRVPNQNPCLPSPSAQP